MPLTRTAAGCAACLALALAPASGFAQASPRTSTPITQPPPPVTASDFPIEPTGTPPADGDGLIPNPATPAGSPIAAPSSCTVTFASASGATSATVNSWITAHENSITTTTVLCLAGTFTSPIHVWSKSSTALLEIAPAPGATATLDLGEVRAADTNVTARSDTTTTSQSVIPHRSICFLNGNSCSDIYVIGNTVQDITNTADEDYTSKSVCGNGNVDGYGIAVIAAGSATSPNPPGQPGTSTVAGHDPFALYIDAFGSNAKITDVYVHDNTLQNQSQFFLTPSAGDTVNGNFALPSNDWLTLADWQAHNGHGWDADSVVGGFSPNCPARSIP